MPATSRGDKWSASVRNAPSDAVPIHPLSFAIPSALRKIRDGQFRTIVQATQNVISVVNACFQKVPQEPDGILHCAHFRRDCMLIDISVPLIREVFLVVFRRL